MKKQLIEEAFRLQTLAGITPINEAGKDYDRDGKIESPEEEYKGSRDKAIKKAQGVADDTSKMPAERDAARNKVYASRAKKESLDLDECWECDQEEDVKDFTRGHDHEGYMAHSELKSLQSNASRLMNIIGDDNAELPGWVSTYISLAADYMNSVTDYLSAMEPESEEHNYE